MNAMIPIMILIVITWLVMIWIGYSLSRRGSELTALYRRIKNPPYPITAKELQEELRANQGNLMKFNPFTLFIRQQKILWSRYPDPKDAELAQAVKEMKHQLLKGLLVFLVLVLLIIAVFTWALVTGQLHRS